MASKKQEWIVVDADTIAQASKEDSAHCMIADALKKAMPNATGVTVDLQTIRFSDREAGKRYVYLTPDLCQIQLLRFDQGVVVEPWCFRLPIRTAQVIPITANKENDGNFLKRPHSVGPKKVTGGTNGHPPRVTGGTPPPMGLLSHSPGFGKHKGKTRQFGIKAAGSFSPGPGKIDITV